VPQSRSQTEGVGLHVGLKCPVFARAIDRVRGPDLVQIVESYGENVEMSKAQNVGYGVCLGWTGMAK